MAFVQRALSFKFQLGTGSFGDSGGANTKTVFERSRQRADRKERRAGNEPRVYADMGLDRLEDESAVPDRRKAGSRCETTS
jgi:hypothetical protein